MSNWSYLAVYAAVCIPAVLFVRRAWKIRSEVTSPSDFFPLKRILSGREYRATTVAASMSLATVMIYFINFSALMGAALFVNVISFCASIVLMWFLVPRLMDLNPDNLTVQSFLGRQYDSRFIRNTSQCFTLIGYLSIFSVELLVGVTVLSPFFGNYVLLFAALYLVFLLVYSVTGGYRAVVATDRLQLLFICSSVLALFAFLLYFVRAHDSLWTIQKFVDRLTNTTQAPLAFILGITFMNLPAPISDAGTWQRICSGKDAKTVQSALKGVFVYFFVLWSALILLGIAFSTTSLPAQEYADKTSLINTIVAGMAQSNSFLGIAILFVFMMGLFSAMVSTADSILIVASQILSIDWLHEEKERDVQIALRKCRTGLIGLGIGSFLLFVFFTLVKLNIVDLVFAIYGAQLAMVPVTLGALFLSERFRHARVLRAGAVLSIALGFVLAWVAALYGKATGQAQVIYIAPLVGFMASAILFGLGLLVTLTIHRPHSSEEA